MKKFSFFIFAGFILAGVGLVFATGQSKANKETKTLQTNNSASNLQVIGYLGGSAQAVTVNGSYVYLGLGNELAVIDVSGSDELARTGYILLPGSITNIEVAEEYAYVTYHNDVSERITGVWVIDISDPMALTAVGVYELSNPSANDAFTDVKTVGNYLYLLNLLQMQVIDISYPENPTLVLQTSYGGSDMVVTNKNLFINGFTFFRLLDISNPANPIYLGESSFIPGANSITATGEYVYAVTGTRVQPGHLIITDVSNPANPTQVTDYLLPGSYAGYQIVAVDKHIYLGVDASYIYQGNAQMWIMDVSNPDLPTQIGIYEDSPLFINDLAIAGNKAYLSGETGKLLRMIDLTDPTAPTEGGYYTQPNYYSDLLVVGNYIYANASYDSWLRILDISDPTYPDAFAWYETSYPTALTLAGDFFYFSDLEGLHIVDVSTPISPVEVGSLPFGARDIKIIGNFAYIVDGNSLKVVDVTNPAQPMVVGTTGSDLGNKLAIIADYAYVLKPSSVLDFNSYISIVNIADPTNPVVIGTYESQFDMYTGIVARGNYLYVVSWGAYDYPPKSFIRELDVSDPINPVEIGNVSLGEYHVSELIIDEYRLFVALEIGLALVDISNPGMPVLADSYRTPTEYDALTVTSAEGYVYVGGATGLTILQIVGLTGRVYDYYYTPVSYVSVAVGNNLTVTTGVDGRYLVTEPLSGTYTLTPTLDGYAFWPPTRTVTIPPLGLDQNFTILAGTVSTTLSTTLVTLTYTDTQGLPTQLLFPAGAVSETTTITVTPILTSDFTGWRFTGHAFELTAVQPITPLLNFNRPVSATIIYSDQDLWAITDESQLNLRWWDGTTWIEATNTCSPSLPAGQDTAHNTITTPLCRVGRYVLFGPTHHLFLPVMRCPQQVFGCDR